MADMLGQGDCVRMKVYCLDCEFVAPVFWMFRDADFYLGYVTRGQNIQMLVGLSRETVVSV